MPRVLSLLVLGVALLITALASLLAAERQRTEAERIFSHRAEQAATLVEAQFSLYTTLVQAGMALYAGAGADDVDATDWRRFVDAMDIPGRFPGVTSVPYIRHVPAEALPRVLAEIRDELGPGFALDVPGERDVYCPIIYNEPAPLPPPGYDACERPIPHATMMHAHAQRSIALSASVTVTDRDGRSGRGTVMYGPVYTANGELHGWVALPVAIARVLDGVVAVDDTLALRLRDGTEPDAPVLFAHGDWAAHGSLSRRAELDIAGRHWVLEFAYPAPGYTAAAATLASGFVISLLLWLLLWRAGAVHARAVALADQMTLAFRESEAQRRRAEEFSLVMATRIGLDGRWQHVPITLAHLLGRHPSKLTGTHYSEVLVAEDFARHWRQCERLLAGEIRSFDMEQRFLHADGHVLWLYVNWSIVTDTDGNPLQFLAYLRDVSDSKLTHDALQRSEEKYRTIIESLEDAYFESDLSGNLTFFNDALVRTLDHAPDELMGKNNQEYMHPDDHKAVFQAFNRVFATGESRRGLQWRVLTKDKETRFVEASISLIRDAAGEPVGFRGIARDITERREADARIHHLAHYDALTGLPNRTLFEDRVKQALRRRRRDGERAALLFLDLDRFKTVNDSLGHQTGDMLLQAVAQRLISCVRAGDTVCRPGGDEFLVLLADLPDSTHAANVAAKILTTVAEPYLIEGWEFSITPSVGIAVIPDDGDDLDTLVRNADAAMYHAKESGRNNFQFFTPELTQNASERLSLEHGLRRALERDELELYYQPLVDVRNGRIVGAEALLRWNRPGQGVVAAGEFIGIVEQSGLILGIGDWVLSTACRQAQAWHRRLGKPLPVSVNLSALQFRQHGLSETIARALEEAELEPACLELELTESVVMQDAALTIDTVKKLRELGVHFAIDDFGTGYSSLSYLKRFPIDRVKIDRSFVRDLAKQPDDPVLINAIISMARSLRMEVIAEGVETHEQKAYLYQRDCFIMQGYLFSRPVPAAEFEKLLEQGTIHP